MYKRVIILVVTLLLMGSLFSHANAQMMMFGTPSVTPNPTEVQQQQQDEAQGKQLFDQLQNNQTTCKKLTDSDFEKIGEYSMSQMFGGNTAAHIAMNQRIQQMHGDTGEEQMHIQIGKSVTNCNTTNNQQGGVTGMMGNWGGWTGSMMGGNWFGAFGVFAFLFWLVGFIDLILLGIFLWKRIGRK